MRSLFFCLVLLALVSYLQAQNAVQIQQSTQIAVQTSQQAAQTSAQAAERANEQAIRDAQQANQNAHPVSGCTDCVVRTPRFSMKSGTYSVPFTVTITADRNAVVYYTLDGWTPTVNSDKYTGPIEVDRTATLQAVAVSPRGRFSRITTADFKLTDTDAASVYPGLPPVEITSTAPSRQRTIPKGTAVPLMFVSAVSSKSARVGDTLALALAQDLTSDGVVWLSKGTPAVATVTAVDKPRGMGVPGEIFFQADYIQADGTTIKLGGSAAKQGQDQVKKASALTVGVPAGIFVHGKDAEIRQGALFTAYVENDALLPMP